MKTVLTLPDDLLKLAKKTAERLGIPLWQLFIKALEDFIEHYREKSITEKLNEVYSSGKSENDTFIEKTQKKAFARGLDLGSW